MNAARYRDSIAAVSCYLLVAGIFALDFFRALPSIAMIGVVASAVFFTNPATLVRNFLHRKTFLVLSVTFLFLLPSFFYSQNHAYFWERLQIHLPYLLLPLAFASLDPMKPRVWLGIYYLFFLLALVTSVIAFVNYLMHQAEVNQLYLESRVMPTFVSHHPTFSLMIAFGSYIAYFLRSKNVYLFHVNEKYLLAGGGIFLFIFLHVFSVRSGLIVLYALVFAEFYRLTFIRKQWKTGFISLAVCLLAGVITLAISPTVRNKFINTSKDLSIVRNNESANHYSLASRMLSYKNAFSIAGSTSWLWGCGLGDVEDMNTGLFRANHPDVSKIIIPHNQFLYFLAATGIIGVVVFSCSFFYPLFAARNYRNELLFAHYLILLVAFQFEALLETQLGVAYSVIFILLPLNRAGSEAPEEA
jgi:O-antigen ligase